MNFKNTLFFISEQLSLKCCQRCNFQLNCTDYSLGCYTYDVTQSLSFGSDNLLHPLSIQTILSKKKKSLQNVMYLIYLMPDILSLFWCKHFRKVFVFCHWQLTQLLLNLVCWVSCQKHNLKDPKKMWLTGSTSYLNLWPSLLLNATHLLLSTNKTSSTKAISEWI